jgi:hypothetical protein
LAGEDQKQPGEDRGEARRSAAEPQAEVGCRGGEKEIDGIAFDSAQDVAAEAEVTLEVTDSRFDGGTTAEALSGLTSGVVGGVGFGCRGDQQFD